MTSSCPIFIIITLLCLPIMTSAEETSKKQPTGLALVRVKGGCFQQGSDRSGFMEKPRHEVCLSDFYIGKYEVTQRDWRDVMGNNPSRFRECGDDCPVDSVSWNNAREFIRTLNAITGRDFRLPTEAEWEYACRGGNNDNTYCGSSDADTVAWQSGNSSFRPHQVGLKQPNSLGIHDMSGNAWEWVFDFSGTYSHNHQSNPAGPLSGSTRVRRGGSWQYGPEKAASVWRSSGYPDDRAMDIGFRLAHP
jgi:formylglycine-generating enzyme required for sulfatase activity